MDNKASTPASTTDDIAFFEGLQQAEILAGLEAMYAKLTGLAVITAPLGTGVTTLIRQFTEVLPANQEKYADVSCAIIDASDNTVAGFLCEVLAAFGYELEDARQSELMSLTAMIFQHQAQAGLAPLIAIEHLDGATPKILELVNQLASLRVRNQGACRIILTGTPRISSIVNAEKMNEVAKRISYTATLNPMTDGELHAFIGHTLREKSLAAHDTAVDSLVRLSDGLPGPIVRAIDYAAKIAKPGQPLDSGDLLLALESRDLAFPNVVPDKPQSEAPQPTEPTMIGRVALDVQDPEAFDDGTSQAGAEAPLGEILVNCNGKLLQRYVVSRRKVLIGRAPHNDIVLDSRWVSRHHAILVCEPHQATLADVNSTNGLTINSRETRQSSLMDSDIIVIGDFRLKYLNPNAVRPEPEDGDKLNETRVLRTLSADKQPERTIKTRRKKKSS